MLQFESSAESAEIIIVDQVIRADSESGRGHGVMSYKEKTLNSDNFVQNISCTIQGSLYPLVLLSSRNEEKLLILV